MGIFVNFVAGADPRTIPGAQGLPLMINVPQHCMTAGRIERTRLMTQMAGPAYLAQDSGGFQILKEKEKILKRAQMGKPVRASRLDKITPIVIAEAAARLNPTLMIALDNPVRRLKYPEERDAEFKAKFDSNVVGATETFKQWRKHCPQVAFFVPFQGYSLTHLHKFLEAIGGISFHGFCMPLRSMGLQETGLLLTRLWQLGVRNIHLLGVSSFFSIALGAFAAKNLFRWVSLDSQTWHTAARVSEYLSPYDLSRVKIKQNLITPKVTVLDCPCRFCKGRTFAYIKHLPYPDRTMFLRGHNHAVTEKAFRDLYNHAGSIRTLVSFVESRSRSRKKVQELYETLCLVETFKKQDLRYFQDLLNKEVN
jgi:queuine/archaeosine tRNA-ribosyltransferase